MDLESILGGFWRDLRALGRANGYENAYVSKEVQVLPPGCPKGGFGEGSGRIRADLGKVLGGFWQDFKKIFQEI